MKLKYLFLFFAFFTCVVFNSCENEVITETLYEGVVIDSVSRQVFPDLEVCVTNGENIYQSTHTNASGAFSILVKVNEVKNGYYLLVGDSSCAPVRKELIGLGGKSEIDLGVIEVAGPHKPIVKTLPVRSEKVGTAVSGGDITNGGRAFISARGVCWSSKEQYPTLENCEKQFTADGTGAGKYESNIANLDLGTTYYIRAYATNRIGTGYGDPVTITVEDGLAQVRTESVFEIYADRAKCEANVVSDGGFKVVERGVCWSTIPEPTISDAFEKANADTGRFVCQLRGLALSTPYYVRAYVRNETDITYGNELQFMSANGLPEVVTGTYTARATSVTISGEVKDNGGYPVTERGICYSTTNMSPTSSDEVKQSGAGNGSFTVTITDLTPGKTYYFRAYAKNQNDYNYGDPKPVTTGTGVPTVALKITSITATTASTIVKVTDFDGADLDSCGICWSENPNPNEQGKRVIAGGRQLNTEYICNISGLEPKKTYYICAFAKTDVTENYSDVDYFKTAAGEPVVTTITPAAAIGTNYLVISGSTKTTSDAPVLHQGICWSTIANPTKEDNFVEATSVSANPFSCKIDGLQSGTTYYCCAYAENKFGPAYGKSEPFTTDYNPAVLKGYAYDQDGFPVSGVSISGNRLSATTDQDGYYEISINLTNRESYDLSATKSGYKEETKSVSINPAEVVQVDYTISLEKTCDVDLGNGQWVDGPAKMIFECHQKSLAGKTTTRNMRLKNYRPVPVTWQLSNLPSQGVQLSQTSGTIPANGEISIIVTLTYPSTNAQLINLAGCSSGNKTYVWNWEAAVGGVYMHDAGYGNYVINQDPCAACCEQGVYIYIGEEQGGFHMTFNQFATF